MLAAVSLQPRIEAPDLGQLVGSMTSFAHLERGIDLVLFVYLAILELLRFRLLQVGDGLPRLGHSDALLGRVGVIREHRGPTQGPRNHTSSPSEHQEGGLLEQRQ
eukprot:CAMPEP_0180756070 /NCGR_PEP_ID=MMETSP1038_2-20121128/34032_1 /TAXON_ID=632150 /ORGANISM="Azadinium spinosum, Strain 3D9" /LENGTH=104 /DNA_ID=CAMNT_0022790023 /DNA_START=172 /DNA_END=486 /DNA_ORIENTATION=+